MSNNGRPPRPSNRIFLTGFMGAGKSAVGRVLAKRLGWRFVDTDTLIEARASRTIPEIFATEGEKRFRDLEGEIIREICLRPENAGQVVALGGGALLRPQSLETVLASGDLIYLEARLETLIERLQRGWKRRPLLQGDSEAATIARITALFSERRAHYESSPFSVATDGESPGQVADKILKVRQR